MVAVRVPIDWASVLASVPTSLEIETFTGFRWSIPMNAEWPGHPASDEQTDSTADVITTTRETYDAIGDAYAAANADLPESVLEAMAAFVAALPTHAVVADVGCGPGRDLAELRRRGLRAVGFDLSLGMLRAGGQSGVAVANMTRPLPVASRSLDGIWCAAAFLHVPRELASSTLAIFGGVLKVGGVLHLSVSEGEGEGLERDPYLEAGVRWFVHHTEADLLNLLAEHSYVVRQIRRSESRRRWLTITAVREEPPAPVRTSRPLRPDWTPGPTRAVAEALAPSGVLRASINLGNPVLAQGTPDAPSGVTVDIATELAARLGVPVAFVCFDAARKSFEAMTSGAADVCFLAIEPARERDVAFTAPYAVIDGAYVVPEDSALVTIDDVDTAGIRIGVKRGSAYDLFLTRTLEHATLVRGDEGVDVYLTEALEVGAGIRAPVEAFAVCHDGHRVLPGRFMQIRQALGIPKESADIAVGYVRGLIDELIASGFIAESLARSGQTSAGIPRADGS